MKLAVLFQMTFVGMPCVFYGDEKGMTGVLEEEYRHPMPWDNKDSEIQAFYKKAAYLRQQYAALRRGSFRMIFAERDGGLYHYIREGDQTIGVMMNRSNESVNVSIPGEILWQEQWNCDILGAYGFVLYRK